MLENLVYLTISTFLLLSIDINLKLKLTLQNNKMYLQLTFWSKKSIFI